MTSIIISLACYLMGSLVGYSIGKRRSYPTVYTVDLTDNLLRRRR